MRKFRNLKITPKLATSVILVAGFFTVLNSYFSYEISKDNLQESIQEDLVLMVKAKKEYLDKFLDYHKARIADWCSDRFIGESFKKIIENQDGATINDLSDYIKANKHSLLNYESEIAITDIFDIDGVVRVSTDSFRIGHTESHDELNKEYNFDKAKVAKYGDVFHSSLVHEPDEPGHLSGVPMWHISAPLILHGDDDKVIGIMVNHILADGLNNVLLSDWQINTDEGIEPPKTYLVSSRDKLVITPTGFNENMILGRLIDTEPVKKCAENKQEMIGSYKDHKGVAVIGASLCINNKWILLAEIEEAKIFSAMKNLKSNILILSSLMIAALLALMYILSRNIIRPIKNLTAIAEKIAKGDLSQRVPVSSNDEIGKFSKIFNEMVQKMEETDRAKSEFVSLASHQLLTPMTTVGWIIETLLFKTTDRLNEDQKKYLKDIYDVNHNMIELVRALLDVSRIELGVFSIEPKHLYLMEIMDSALDESTPKINEKNLSIDKVYDKNMPTINMDPNLTKIIFQNLISNAVKYTPEKGKISIEIKKQDSEVIVKVSDTGYGIPKELQSKLFSKFFRAYNIKEKSEGTGLGLYIVKSILDNCGGKIRFESEENKGTTFYVLFPIEGMKAKEGTKQLGT